MDHDNSHRYSAQVCRASALTKFLSVSSAGVFMSLDVVSFVDRHGWRMACRIDFVDAMVELDLSDMLSFPVWLFALS